MERHKEIYEEINYANGIEIQRQYVVVSVSPNGDRSIYSMGNLNHVASSLCDLISNGDEVFIQNRQLSVIVSYDATSALQRGLSQPLLEKLAALLTYTPPVIELSSMRVDKI